MSEKWAGGEHVNYDAFGYVGSNINMTYIDNAYVKQCFEKRRRLPRLPGEAYLSIGAWNNPQAERFHEARAFWCLYAGARSLRRPPVRTTKFLCRPPVSLPFSVAGGWFSRLGTSSNSVIILNLPFLCHFRCSSSWLVPLDGTLDSRWCFLFLRKKLLKKWKRI